MVDYKKTGFKLLGFAMIITLVLGAIFLGAFFWPFLIAIIIAMSLEKIIKLITKKTKLPKKLVGTILVIITYALIGTAIYLLISKLIKEIVIISVNIPKFYDYSVATYKNLYIKYINIKQDIPVVISDKIYETGIKILDLGTTFATNLFNAILDFIIFMPSILIYIIITFLATLFLVTDRGTIKKKMEDVLPNRSVEKVSDIMKSTFKSLGKYLRAQLIIITVTFFELLIAFLIIKQPYALTLALIISLVDALPILGTGTVLIPWSIYLFITGNIPFAIAIAVTYFVILIVRQLIEPKIVSHQLGVHPFITLIAMYIGFKIFGIIGMIIGPIVMVILKNVFATLFEAGYFKKLVVYKEKDIEK